MSFLRSAMHAGWVSCIICGGNSGIAQTYPSKPVRIITAQAGGGGDFESRMIAQEISPHLGQQIIVDNRPGGLVAGLVAKAPADGYTLMTGGPTVMFAPLLTKATYDTVKDFAPITVLGVAPYVLVVHPSVPAKSVKELIALAKAKPGELNYSTAATGSGVHLAAELFKSMTGVNMVRIPYTSGGPAVAALLGGELHLTFGTAPAVTPLAKAGRLRALAHTGTKPSALAPGLPTVAESGVPGFEFVSYDFLAAPANTPQPIIQRLNEEVVRLLSRADVKDKYVSAGLEAAPSTPDELSTIIRREFAKVGKLIKDAGIKAD